MARWGIAPVLLVLLAGCQGTRPPDPLYLEATPTGSDTRLTLLTAPGLKLNARLKPALELPNGTVLRFDSPHLTPDSAYFTQPPSTIVAGRQIRWRGTLRASICDEGGRVCRSVVLDL
jgi:hypothetical protein